MAEEWQNTAASSEMTALGIVADAVADCGLQSCRGPNAKA